MPAARGRSGGGRVGVDSQEDPVSRRDLSAWVSFLSSGICSGCWTGTGTGPLSRERDVQGTSVRQMTGARTPGTIPIKPPAQRRMGVKRRLVDQGARTHPCVSTVLLLHDTAHLRHRYREIRPVTDLDARLPMHGAKYLNPVITLKNLLPPGRGPMLRDGPALAIP